MTDDVTFDPVAFQRSKCEPSWLRDLDQSPRPSPARFLAVVTGQSSWTTEEEEQIAADPKLRDYEAQLREALLGDVSNVATEPLAAARPTIVLTRVHQPVLAAAHTDPHTVPVRFANDHGYEVLIYPAAVEGQSTIEFVGRLPPAPFTLSWNDKPVPLTRPIDSSGFGRVATCDLTAIDGKDSVLSINAALDSPFSDSGQHRQQHTSQG